TYCYPDVVSVSQARRVPYMMLLEVKADDVVKEKPNSESDEHLPAFAIDMSDAEVDFVYHSNITSMFGVSEYILFAPADQIDDAIMTEDQKNVVISAFRVAQHSVDCEVPMFIQFGHIERQLFFGTSCNKSIVAHYGGSHLRKGQMRHMHLSGLLDLFKEHVKCPLSLLETDDIRVSVQFDYTIKFASFPPGEIDDSNETLDCYSLPFGSRDEPISEFNLIASWPNMKEEMINENEYHSDLDLLSAFNWSGAIDFRYTEGLLDYVLMRVIDLHRSKVSSENAFSLLDVRQYPKAFGQLTDGGIKNIRFAGAPNTSITNPGGLPLDEVLMPIAKSVLKRCMDRVFEVADFSEEADVSGSFNQLLKSTPGSAVRSSPEPHVPHQTSSYTSESEMCDSELSSVYATIRQNKWTPPDSVTFRFVMAFANASVDHVFGPYAFAQVWLEFVARLRTYYDKTKDLPGLWIRQLIFEKEEFFDAQSDQSDTSSNGSRKSLAVGTSSIVKSSSEPVGRLHPFGEMRLLKHEDTPLYVPVTQDRSPMTEDMVDEYTNYLSSLDDGEARVKAQLDVLCSDMQAFKAANPKCCLEDFIRWHSPKDWLDEEECLSERMQLPDNTWVKCWNEAMPIPVINQARLFNESKIAEEILSLLENATVQQMVDFVRPVLFVAAVLQIIEKGKCMRDLLNKQLLLDSVYRANRSGSRDDYVEALKHIKAAELFVSQYSSLYSKLRLSESSGSLIEPPSENDLFSFITSLIEDASSKRESNERNVISRGVPIFGASDGPVGNAVRIMLERSDVTGGKLPAPARRQYIIRWSVPRPSAHSRMVPQRLFASIEQEEFRLCGAFAEDTVYI
ncbi:hypothetical protein GCK32_008321, partial [Trichostrongylus colubriformis]